MDGLPLVVDLDGTLTYGDTGLRSLFAFVRRNPLALPLSLWWQLHSRARVKQELASRWDFRPEEQPYIKETVEFLRSESEAGRRLILCTGSTKMVAEKIASFLGIFEDVLGTDGEINLIGEAKAGRLVSLFGEKGFDYAGNSMQDLRVWRYARRAIVVNAPAKVLLAAERIAEIERLILTEDVRKGRNS